MASQCTEELQVTTTLFGIQASTFVPADEVSASDETAILQGGENRRLTLAALSDRFTPGLRAEVQTHDTRLAALESGGGSSAPLFWSEHEYEIESGTLSPNDEWAHLRLFRFPLSLLPGYLINGQPGHLTDPDLYPAPSVSIQFFIEVTDLDFTDTEGVYNKHTIYAHGTVQDNGYLYYYVRTLELATQMYLEQDGDEWYAYATINPYEYSQDMEALLPVDARVSAVVRYRGSMRWVIQPQGE